MLHIIPVTPFSDKGSGLGGAGGLDYTRKQSQLYNIMMPSFRAVLVSLVLVALPAGADTVQLKDGHPERYTVVKGDTLWDISSHFLRDPWRWPNIWNKNAQIKNPHLIYPGDVIVLTYRDGEPQLDVLRTQKLEPVANTETGEPGSAGTVEGYSGPVVRLSPKPRQESLPQAIPTIKPDAIMPFLSQPLALEDPDLRDAGYVTVGLDRRLALGNLSQFYARGLGDKPSERYQVFRPGKALRDPDTGEVLAYEAVYLGDAKLLEPGDPSKLEVTAAKQEITPGDRLLRAANTPAPLPYYYPHAPAKQISGRIISVLNGVNQFGPDSIVAINRGKRDGVDEGQVLRILYHAGTGRDPVTHGHYRIPDEEAGILMVFRPFERVSYALVMRATRPLHLLDSVETP